MENNFNPDKAWLKGPDAFKRFLADTPPVPLLAEKLKGNDEIIVAERKDAQVSFVMRELSVPHMAQGDLAGEPYVVSF